MSEGARGNRKLILILSALLAGCGGGSAPQNNVAGNAVTPALAPPPAAFDWAIPAARARAIRNMRARRHSAASCATAGRRPPTGPTRAPPPACAAATPRRSITASAWGAIRRGRASAPSPESRPSRARALRRAGDADDDLRQRRRRAPRRRPRHSPRLRNRRAPRRPNMTHGSAIWRGCAAAGGGRPSIIATTSGAASPRACARRTARASPGRSARRRCGR